MKDSILSPPKRTYLRQKKFLDKNELKYIEKKT